jgi:hypothetical protein
MRTITDFFGLMFFGLWVGLRVDRIPALFFSGVYLRLKDAPSGWRKDGAENLLRFSLKDTELWCRIRANDYAFWAALEELPETDGKDPLQSALYRVVEDLGLPPEVRRAAFEAAVARAGSREELILDSPGDAVANLAWSELTDEASVVLALRVLVSPKNCSLVLRALAVLVAAQYEPSGSVRENVFEALDARVRSPALGANRLEVCAVFLRLFSERIEPVAAALEQVLFAQEHTAPVVFLAKQILDADPECFALAVRSLTNGVPQGERVHQIGSLPHRCNPRLRFLRKLAHLTHARVVVPEAIRKVARCVADHLPATFVAESIDDLETMCRDTARVHVVNPPVAALLARAEALVSDPVA